MNNLHFDDCINSYLAFQQRKKEAGVYSLVKKPFYFTKHVVIMDYDLIDLAFTQLTADFMKRASNILSVFA